MSPRVLNTVLVQRIETVLGVPLSKSTHLAKGQSAQSVLPLGRTVPVRPIESSTQKPVLPQGDAPEASQRSGPHQRVGVLPGQTSTHSPTTQPIPPSPADSTRMRLSPVGTILYSLFEQFPDGAGPLRSERPLFLSAVMHLREQAMTRMSDLEPAAKARAQTASNPTAPPLPSSSTLSGALAAVLQQIITRSGLFYEAQLARALHTSPQHAAQLRDQPQSRAKKGVLNESSNQDDGVRSIVRQQLDVLSNQTVQWHGQAWPGAKMEWEIRPWDDDSDGNQNENQNASEQEEKDKPWCSTISLTMPNLGNVQAKIWLLGQSVRITLSPEQEVSVFSRATDQLHQRFEQIGIDALLIDVITPSETKDD